MTRKEQLKQCRICQNRQMSKVGLICKLTNAKASFSGECQDHKIDIAKEETFYIALRAANDKRIKKFYKVGLTIAIISALLLIQYCFGHHIILGFAVGLFLIFMNFKVFIIGITTLLLLFIVIYYSTKK